MNKSEAMEIGPSTSELISSVPIQSSQASPTRSDGSNEASGVCDWKILDEISISLLESGICTFPILQAVLPSILLADVNDSKTAENLPKLFRIAQMQIEHLLKTQRELVEKLEQSNQKLAANVLISTLIKSKSTPIYECATCKKTFVSRSFLQSHLKRRHGGSSSPK